jgi:cellulose synthase/poly-beta-1,6-N-acetylglucosamine synthase-like glycosyltransferase
VTDCAYLPAESPPPPAVSIVTATYNRPAVLAFAIRSILKQDLRDWELIVVGDRSSSECRPSRRKVSCHRQRTALVGFKRDLLRQHDVACDEIISGHETPAHRRVARVVQLVNIGGCAMADSIPLSAMAADDIEISMRIILRKLRRREPLPQQPEAARFAIIFVS